MGFKFSLEKVLSQRKIKMDLARKDYLESQDFLFEEQKKLENLKIQKDEAFKKRSEIIQSQSSWHADVESINQFLVGQDLRIAQQNERLIKIEKVVESRREILKECLIEVKIVEKLRANKKAEYLQEVDKKERKELDEISSIRFVRTTKDE